ncbi:fatty acid desaturase [Rhizobiales bacterium]|uniref:fatty acid desaturase n=1 Tax=Hongsoonwoonella zoysiae TaxID=2821844 RepID=UPI001561962C|nr:fatty acid desaturase [Hongsoonwoonella zoysiae]NRG17781.1 fatty acid desaturase [Hongsoonwoonella zoysiae]
MIRKLAQEIEWPTVALILACYAAWFWLTLGSGQGLAAPLWVVATGLVTTLYWSLTHEVVHGHPTRNACANAALVFIPIGWIFPFGRFRDTHLAHHATGELTDPFDDPESWYLARSRWKELSRPLQAVLSFNNTLAGRLLIGPAVSTLRFVSSDVRLVSKRDAPARRVRRCWWLHLLSAGALALSMARWSAIPFWQFAAATYLGFSILLIRTFAEHQAAKGEGERTVVIEDRGPLAWLFLFNNLHAAHHHRPGLAWYRLPAFYQRHREVLLTGNDGYAYPSYFALMRRHFLKAKEPVAHPFTRRRDV